MRHGHIFDLYGLACASPALEVVAACEEHAETRAEIRAKETAAITHDQIEQMLDEVDCDIVATGTYFAGRGPVLIEALSRGKHVISDKPLCTRMADLDRIAALAGEKDLKVGCMLTMRDAAPVIGARNLIQAGRIGEVHAIAFGGQHPLLLGSRPGWYFEQGKHGGTITDIGIHAIDALPWVTGRQWAKINAARCWRAFVPEDFHMQDAGQMMLEMDNGCGVLGDVSYFAPDRAGYTMPYYWRTTFWGQRWSNRDCDYGQGNSSARQGRRHRADRAAAPSPTGWLPALFPRRHRRRSARQRPRHRCGTALDAQRYSHSGGGRQRGARSWVQ